MYAYVHKQVDKTKNVASRRYGHRFLDVVIIFATNNNYSFLYSVYYQSEFDSTSCRSKYRVIENSCEVDSSLELRKKVMVRINCIIL